MAYLTHAIPGTPFHYARLYEDYGLRDAAEMLRELAATNASLTGHSVMCDVRDGRVKMAFDEIYELARVFRECGHVFTGVRWSVIVPGVLEYGIARSAGLMVEAVPFEYHVTQNADVACTWAGVPVRLLQRWRSAAIASSEAELSLSGLVGT